MKVFFYIMYHLLHAGKRVPVSLGIFHDRPVPLFQLIKEFLIPAVSGGIAKQNIVHALSQQTAVIPSVTESQKAISPRRDRILLIFFSCYCFSSRPSYPFVFRHGTHAVWRFRRSIKNVRRRLIDHLLSGTIPFKLLGIILIILLRQFSETSPLRV